MRAFKVELNGKRVCLAGVGANGVLTAIASYVGGTRRKPDMTLEVGGLFSETKEHATWARIDLKAGDRVTVKVVETGSFDKPRKRYRVDSKTEHENQKAYVRAWAKKFGWTISKKRAK